MGLDKFIDLLSNKTLHFGRVTDLTDAYEYTLPATALEGRRAELLNKGFAESEVERKLLDFVKKSDEARSVGLVNCWSMGPSESYGLWKIYLGGAKAGVAIRTRFSRLRKALSQVPERIFAAKVVYANHFSQFDPSREQLITTKRTFYEYEKEVRLFMFPTRSLSPSVESTSMGKVQPERIPVKLGILIDELYVSPFVGRWFVSSLKETVSRLDSKIGDKITTSAIQDS